MVANVKPFSIFSSSDRINKNSDSVDVSVNTSDFARHVSTIYQNVT